MMARLSNVLSQSQSRSVCKTAFDRPFTNCDLVSSFQWHFCSNFVCIGCYVRLPSLHDLYDHIEEAHVGPNGPMSWPPKVQHSLTEFVGSRANSLSPNDSPPSCFMLFQTAYSTPQPTSDFSSNEDTFQLDYFTTCDADNLPHCPPLRHPLSRFERPCTRPSSPYVPPLVEPIHCHAATLVLEQDPALGSQYESSVGPIRSRLRDISHRKDAASFPKKSTPSKVRSTVPPAPAKPISTFLSNPDVTNKRSTRKSSKKDLLLPCPIPGCTKIYRNSGGLKYHTEKGTCTFDEDNVIQVVDPQPTMPESPPPHVSSAPLRPLAPASPKCNSKKSARHPARPLPPIDYLITPVQSPDSSSSSSPISPLTPRDPYIAATPLPPISESLLLSSHSAEASFLDEHSFDGERKSYDASDSVIAVDGVLAFRQQPKVPSNGESSPLFSYPSLHHQSPAFISRSLSPLSICVSRSTSPSPAPGAHVPTPAEILMSLADDESDCEPLERVDMVLGSKSIGEAAGNDKLAESEIQMLHALLIDVAALGAAGAEDELLIAADV